ncbi:MAG TPA: cytochrome c-type biogenesis protein CcmH [Acidimicrobiales bacterium]|nr:cytochrome c-type biogenesis protein CcmH [Acidimicrobiales bacterium]
MNGHRRLAVAWALLVVVLAGALVIGSRHPAPPASPSQRAAAIDAVLRCPSCEGISVAQSSASTAVAIRQLVRERVAQGQSTQQIEDFLVSRYGESILLEPPAGGGIGLVWIVPAAAIVVALGALGTVFWRRRRVPVQVVADEDRRLVAEALSGSVDR